MIHPVFCLIKWWSVSEQFGACLYVGRLCRGSSPKHFGNLSTLRCVLVQYERLNFDKWQDSTVRFEYTNKIQ